MALCTYGIKASCLLVQIFVRLEIVLDQKLELSSWEEGIIKAKQLILFELAILNFARLLVITEINSVHKTDFDNYLYDLPGTCWYESGEKKQSSNPSEDPKTERCSGELLFRHGSEDQLPS